MAPPSSGTAHEDAAEDTPVERAPRDDGQGPSGDGASWPARPARGDHPWPASDLEARAAELHDLHVRSPVSMIGLDVGIQLGWAGGAMRCPLLSSRVGSDITLSTAYRAAPVAAAADPSVD